MRAIDCDIRDMRDLLSQGDMRGGAQSTVHYALSRHALSCARDDIWNSATVSLTPQALVVSAVDQAEQACGMGIRPSLPSVPVLRVLKNREMEYGLLILMRRP
jgi:hypothetical protein